MEEEQVVIEDNNKEENVVTDEVNEQKENKQSKGKAFLEYLIKTTNGMALGLFATLIVGVIIAQIGSLFLLAESSKFCIVVGKFINGVGGVLKGLMGLGIGIGVAASLKQEGNKLLGAGAAGAIGAWAPCAIKWTEEGKFGSFVSNNQPIVAFLCAIAAVELMKLVFRKKTPVDIILIPLFMALVGAVVGALTAFPINWLMVKLGEFINWATAIQPILMGIIIAVVMGMLLTAPVSSAAIAISISLGGVAGFAAVVGCCTQMVGFAVQSRKDNKIGMVISIGIGTSMLQFKNILRNPRIWLPTIITSAILGPIATCVAGIECNPTGAGMGTSGLVGIMGTLDASGYGWQVWVWILVLEIVAPGLLVFGFDLLFRKLGWIKDGDLLV